MMNAGLPPPVLCIFAIFGGCHLFLFQAHLVPPAERLPAATRSTFALTRECTGVYFSTVVRSTRDT